jgi:hypothetical protein
MNLLCIESVLTFNLLLASTVSFPLFLALLTLAPGSRPTALMFAPWAALPALLLSLWAEPGTVVKIPWLLLGTHLGVEATAQVFLLFTALL